MGSCLQVPGFAHEKSNLLGLSEEKLEKTSSWLIQSHPYDKAQNWYWWTWVACAPNVSFWRKAGKLVPQTLPWPPLFSEHGLEQQHWRHEAVTLKSPSLPPSIITKAQPLSPQHQPSQLSDLCSIWTLFWAKLNPRSLCQPEITVRVATYDASDINGKYFIFPEAIANLTQNNSSWLMTKLLFKRNEIQEEYRGKGWDPNTRI